MSLFRQYSVSLLLLGFFSMTISMQAFAVSYGDLPAEEESPEVAELVRGVPEAAIEYELIIVDEDEWGFTLEELSYEEIFSEGGLADILGSHPRTASTNKSIPKSCFRKGRCVVRNGEASYYGPGFQGKPTACGEKFNTNDMTAAHPSLPFGTLVKVCYKSKCATVRINDRGPFHGGRVIDLSTAARLAIGMPPTGNVKLNIVRCGA